MAAKQTYSVRLDEDQRRQLEARSESIGLPVGHLIRSAINDFLRLQEEKITYPRWKPESLPP